ncbi:Iron-sulfur cluster carrier protein [subsurface metagenome]|nr:AAA family ATPase [Clostridia bacterium]
MEKVPIAVIDKEKGNIERVSSLLENLTEIEIIQTSTSLEDLELLFQEKLQTLVLLGPAYKLEDAQKLLRNYSTSLRYVKVILLVDKTSTSLLREAIKLNIHDVLEFPFTYHDLNESVKRVKDIFKEILAEQTGVPEEKVALVKKGAKKITVLGTKGGSGKSFIATNLAIDLANLLKKKVTLFDLNYQFGDVALMLNLFPKHTVYDIMSVIDQLDSEMLNSFLTTHSSGVKVLPAPIDPTQDEAISTKTTKKILDILSDFNDYIVIDTPSSFSDNVLLILEETDCLCMITGMDVPSIKNLKITLQLLEQLKFPPEKIILILNRADTKVGITIDEIKKTIGRRNIDITIPSNRVVPLSVNKGVPVVTDVPRSSVSKSIHKLTNLLKSKLEKRK